MKVIRLLLKPRNMEWILFRNAAALFNIEA